MTPEMRQQRAGKLTASMAAVIMGGLDTDGLKSYIHKLAFERLYGLPDDEQFQSQAMTRGIETEAAALEWYAFNQDVELIPGGECIQHPAIPYVGASPDARLPGKTIQVKCPLAHNWLQERRAGVVPATYRWQCRWEMWTCGVVQCDYLIFHPLPGGFIIPFGLTDEDVQAMADRAALVNEMIEGVMHVA